LCQPIRMQNFQNSGTVGLADILASVWDHQTVSSKALIWSTVNTSGLVPES
jgi:hypothetical protein